VVQFLLLRKPQTHRFVRIVVIFLSLNFKGNPRPNSLAHALAPLLFRLRTPEPFVDIRSKRTNPRIFFLFNPPFIRSQKVAHFLPTADLPLLVLLGRRAVLCLDSVHNRRDFSAIASEEPLPGTDSAASFALQLRGGHAPACGGGFAVRSCLTHIHKMEFALQFPILGIVLVALANGPLFVSAGDALRHFVFVVRNALASGFRVARAW
jgi:hypothetical protein